MNQSIYKRCKYVGCNNGPHKRFKLFRFPAPVESQKIWIENTGNNWLKNLSPSTVRSNGLCCVHFKDEDFTDERKTRLRRNRVPIHWSKVEVLPVIKKINIPKKQLEKIEDDEVKEEVLSISEESTSNVIAESPSNVVEESPLNVVAESPVNFVPVSPSNDVAESVTNDVAESPLHVVAESPSNVVEESPSNVVAKSPSIDENCRSIRVKTEKELMTETCLSDKQSNSNFNTENTKVLFIFQEPVNNQINNVINNEIVSRKTTNIREVNSSFPKKTANSLIIRANNCIKKLKSKLETLDERNKVFRKVIKSQQGKIRRLRKQLENKIANEKRTIYDFLHELDITDMARTMINLQLHIKNTPYPDDEKELAKLIYYNSPSFYGRLRTAGVILPSDSTVRSWNSISDAINSTKNTDTENAEFTE